MKLVIICCHITKIIKTVCWRSCHSWIGCPSRRSKVTRISASACIFKHILHSDVATARRRIKLHFKFIKPQSNNKFSHQHRPVKRWIHQESSNHHSQNNQYKCMTPNKFKDFQSTIKGFLEFMNGRNLHRLFVFFLHTFIVPTKFLKSNVYLRKKEKGLTYCVTYLTILNYVKYSTKKIERQTNKLSIGYCYDKLNKSTNYGYMS